MQILFSNQCANSIIPNICVTLSEDSKSVPVLNNLNVLTRQQTVVLMKSDLGSEAL